MFKNRSVKVFLLFLITFSLLTARLVYIQIFLGERLSKLASIQRNIQSALEKPRSDILDKNDISFTNRQKKIMIVLKPALLKGKDDEIEKISKILGSNYYRLKGEIESKSEPIIQEIDAMKEIQILSEKRVGVSTITSLKRFDENTLARHIVGYLNKTDGTGGASIERVFDDILKIQGKNAVSIITDAKSNQINGLGYRISTNDFVAQKQNIRLTLDYHIQKIVETQMEKNKIKGAVVIEDVNTGDVVAMASKPDFDQNQIALYLESAENELFNRAVASYNIGSIFKIVDTVLLLSEDSETNETFLCPGYIKVGGNKIKCSTNLEGGHGWISLKDAFAYSCNSYFIDMGIKLGYTNMIEMARKLGFGTKTGISDEGIEESSGNLPLCIGEYSNGDIANLSIGQGEMMATPLQVTNLVATIANGGIMNKVNIVSAVVDDDGNVLKNIRKREAKRVIEKHVADDVKALMEGVTSYGTGVAAKLEECGGAGGKTGSAETGQLQNGDKIVHAWFTGYFPKDDPKYAMTIFVENGKNGGQVAAPVFAEIAKQIINQKYSD